MDAYLLLCSLTQIFSFPCLIWRSVLHTGSYQGTDMLEPLTLNITSNYLQFLVLPCYFMWKIWLWVPKFVIKLDVTQESANLAAEYDLGKDRKTLNKISHDIYYWSIFAKNYVIYSLIPKLFCAIKPQKKPFFIFRTRYV